MQGRMAKGGMCCAHPARPVRPREGRIRHGYSNQEGHAENSSHFPQGCHSTTCKQFQRQGVLGFAMSLLAQLYSSRWLLLTAIFALYAARKYRRYQRLRHFDGPSGAGVFELWHTRTMLGPQTHLVYKAVNDKYGKWFVNVILG